MVRTKRSAYDYACSFLSVRPRSMGEMRLAMKRRSYPEAETEAALARLSALGLLDDAAFAERWTEYKLGEHKSRAMIREELRGKAVSDADIEAALEKLYPVEREEEEAFFVLQKALRTQDPGLEPGKRALRLLRRLSAQGFSGASIRAALGRSSLPGEDRE